MGWSGDGMAHDAVVCATHTGVDCDPATEPEQLKKPLAADAAAAPIDAEMLEQMLRIASGFPGRTVSLQRSPATPSRRVRRGQEARSRTTTVRRKLGPAAARRLRSKCALRIDGVSANELLNGYFTAREGAS